MISVTMFLEKFVFEQRSFALSKGRERHSHHKCHVVTLSVITVPVTSFKRIIVWNQLPLCLSGVRNPQRGQWIAHCSPGYCCSVGIP